MHCGCGTGVRRGTRSKCAGSFGRPCGCGGPRFLGSFFSGAAPALPLASSTSLPGLVPKTAAPSAAGAASRSEVACAAMLRAAYAARCSGHACSHPRQDGRDRDRERALCDPLSDKAVHLGEVGVDLARDGFYLAGTCGHSPNTTLSPSEKFHAPGSVSFFLYAALRRGVQRLRRAAWVRSIPSSTESNSAASTTT
jgi:hypothetical protein